MTFQIAPVPAFADNYLWLVSDSELGLAMAVDPGDAEAIRRALQKQDLHLALILTTHHHSDHTGGNAKLQRDYGAPVIGPDAERNHIKDMTRGVSGGDVVTFSDLRGQVIDTPGHTSGHIAYYFPALKALFCGDVIFGLGCGRLFEGTAAQMWESLVNLRELPDDTQVYCAHEYTEKNLQFALALDKGNPDLKRYAEEVSALRRQGKPTVPSTLGLEKKLNPFLRVDDPTFQRTLAKNGFPVEGASAAAIFGALRAARDRFGGM